MIARLGVYCSHMSADADSGVLDGYGSICAAAARQVAAAAIAEAHCNGWTVAVAIVDRAGDLVVFDRIDDTQPASIRIAQDKARTASRFRRTTKLFEDALHGGRGAILGMPEVLPLEGGIPLIADGKIAGAIGVSGATSQQDGVCAQAGVDTFLKLGSMRAGESPTEH